MMIDYKFWYIKRDDAGFITEAGVRFFEGNISLNLKGESVYLRSKQLTVTDLVHLNSKIIGDGFIYTSQDFGKIKTNDELRVFLNSELRKDLTRVPIIEQNTLDITKVK